MLPQVTIIPPEGLLVPIPIFKTALESPSSLQAALDVSTQCQHSINLARNGIRGLVLLGSTGEAIQLSWPERFNDIWRPRWPQGSWIP